MTPVTIFLLLLLAGATIFAATADLRDRRKARRPVIQDPARVEAAVQARDLGDIPDGYFDALCDRIRGRYGVPAAFLSLIDRDTQCLKGMSGLKAEKRVLPVDYSVCQFVVVEGRALEFPDTSVAPQLGACKAIGSIGAYFGAPVHFRGQRVGAVGLIDHTARHDLTGIDLRPYVAEVERELRARARATT